MELKHVKSKLSLKSQMMTYLILVALIPTLVISAYYYYNSVNVVKRNTGEINYKVISHIMDNIDNRVEQANQFSDWIYADSNITNLLKRFPADARKYDTTNRQVIDSISRQFHAMPVTKYLLSLIIAGDNGLDIRYGGEAALIEPDDFIQSNWFQQAQKVDDRIFWGSITENYTQISRDRFVIPQYRVIKSLDSGQTLGYSCAFYSHRVFYDCYKEVLLNPGEKIYLTDDMGNIISTNQPMEIGANIRDKHFFKEIAGSSERFFEETIENIINLVTYKKSSKTGWILIKIIPMTQIQEQKNFMGQTTVIWLAGVVLMCIFLSIFLSENLTRPIRMLVWQVNEIAQGNFDTEIPLDVSSEIDVLGKSIIKMKTDISHLIHESLQREKEKRIIEIKMLQSQINPHFLYNTLNSIKLMARLQGAKGIERATVSLGRILKATLSGADEKITLCEEIGILEDYIGIQNIRCNGDIQYHKKIADEGLLECKVIKFILQPIAENAIIHGIQPKGEEGEVTLSIFEKNETLVIEVVDNGVGISEEKMKDIKEKMNADHIFSGDYSIGINNINQRIKLVYGKEFGVSFRSLEGEYTKVAITLPLEF